MALFMWSTVSWSRPSRDHEAGAHMTPIILTTVLLLTGLAKAGPYVLTDVQRYIRPGPGRHRRIRSGRHAARGGCR